jgi:hypothetical protein
LASRKSADQAIAIRPLAEGGKPPLHDVDQPLQQPAAPGIEVRARRPWPPVRLGAQAMLEIPGQPLEPGRPPPAARVAVGAGRDLAELLERLDQLLLAWLAALDELEQHAVARPRQGRVRHRLDVGPVATGDRLRRLHPALGLQRPHPGELAADAGDRVIVFAMDAQDDLRGPRRGHQIGDVLRVIDHAQRRAGQAPAIERRCGQPVDPAQNLVLLGHAARAAFPSLTGARDYGATCEAA